jgi:hypothetical protein
MQKYSLSFPKIVGINFLKLKRLKGCWPYKVLQVWVMIIFFPLKKTCLASDKKIISMPELILPHSNQKSFKTWSTQWTMSIWNHISSHFKSYTHLHTTLATYTKVNHFRLKTIICSIAPNFSNLYVTTGIDYSLWRSMVARPNGHSEIVSLWLRLAAESCYLRETEKSENGEVG